MATKKKAAKKKASPKKKSPSPKVIIKKQPPIRVIVEVVVRTVDDSFNKSIKTFNSLTDEASAAANFVFSFDTKDITVLNLTVESYSQDRPPVSGSFFTPVLDPNTPQKVRVIVLARQDFPGGYGSLSLKHNGKDLSENPVSIAFSSGMGGIDKLLTLPS